MRFTFALVATLLGRAAAQGVTAVISPSAPAPSGCSTSYSGSFEITVATITEKRDLANHGIQQRTTCGANGILVMTLDGGVTKDSEGRTGYIASNYQFQFDNPPQAGAIYTAGFSLCNNNVLALGGNTTFYRCLSGTFYNLYNVNWAAQCEPVSIIAMPCGSSDTASQSADGQVVGTTVVATTIITALSDGQPQVVTTSVPVPMCQIGDGQVQVHTTPCASLPAPTTTAVPVSQYTDGQIQVTPPGSAVASETTAPVATATAPGTTVAPGTAAATTPAAAPTTVVVPTETAPATAPVETFTSVLVSGSVSSTETLTTTGSLSTASTSASSSAATSGSSSTSTAGSSSTTTGAGSATSAPSSSGASSVVGSAAALIVALVAFACL